MLFLLLVGLILIFSVFSLVNFKFVTVLLLLENFNVLLLLFTYLCSMSELRTSFLIFMVVATLEVTLALVALSRLWESDSFYY